MTLAWASVLSPESQRLYWPESVNEPGYRFRRARGAHDLLLGSWLGGKTGADPARPRA
jgi:hypothetical protein